MFGSNQTHILGIHLNYSSLLFIPASIKHVQIHAVCSSSGWFGIGLLLQHCSFLELVSSAGVLLHRFQQNPPSCLYQPKCFWRSHRCCSRQLSRMFGSCHSASSAYQNCPQFGALQCITSYFFKCPSPNIEHSSHINTVNDTRL